MYLNLHESPMMVARALRVYEYWNMQTIERILRPGMTAIDVGANAGDYSLLFARAVGPHGRVIAFEPDPANMTWLRRTLEANHLMHVEALPLALATERGAAMFFPGEKSGWGTLGRKDANSVASRRTPFKVDTTTLDHMVSDLDVDDADVLKIDVEGGDLEVLEGGRSFLRTSERLHLLLDVDKDLTADSRGRMLELLREVGFSVYRVGPTLTPIRELVGGASVIAWKSPA